MGNMRRFHKTHQIIREMSHALISEVTRENLCHVSEDETCKKNKNWVSAKILLGTLGKYFGWRWWLFFFFFLISARFLFTRLCWIKLAGFRWSDDVFEVDVKMFLRRKQHWNLDPFPLFPCTSSTLFVTSHWILIYYKCTSVIVVWGVTRSALKLLPFSRYTVHQKLNTESRLATNKWFICLYWYKCLVEWDASVQPEKGEVLQWCSGAVVRNLRLRAAL